jgi:hypothetical protein
MILPEDTDDEVVAYINRLEDQQEELLRVCREAVRLYTTYGLVAGDADCGKWINDMRAAIDKAEGGAA